MGWSAVVQVHQQVSIECMCWTCPSVCACVCAGAVIGLVYSGPSSCVLVQVSQVAVTSSIECMCWTCPSVCACVCAGAVIGLVYSGPSSCAACQSVLVEVSRGSTGMVAVSSSSEVAAHQVDTFFVSDIPRLAPSSSIRLRHR